MENKRVGLSKKIRFDVFKRDLFCCQYCGKNPPSVILEVDHIVPVIKGGKNNIDNLLTACFDCNRGKGKSELNTLPETTENKILILKEKEKQYKAYSKLLKSIDNRLADECEAVDKVYTSYFPEFCLADKFKHNSLKRFISELGYIQTKNAMDKACYKINDSEGAIKYFCGICWNIINDK